jgi:chromate reductase
MSTYKVGYLVGSLSSTSINRTLAQALIRVAPDTLEFREIPIRDLPLYSPDFDADYPPEGRALKQAVSSSDAILYVSPEYNRSIPGALKNAIDWGSRPWGTNAFARKPSAIIGASPGGIGTAVMQSSLRSVLAFLDSPQLNAPEAYITFSPEAYGPDGECRDESTRAFLTHFMSEFEAFIQRVLSSGPGHIGDASPEHAH